MIMLTVSDIIDFVAICIITIVFGVLWLISKFGKKRGE